MALADRGAAAVRRVPPGWLGAAGVVFFLVLPACMPLPDALAGLADLGLSASLGALLLWIVSEPEHPVVALLDWAPLAYLGTISYGFYLFHNLIPARFGVLPAHVGHVAIPKIVRDTLPEMLQFALAVLLAHLSCAIWKSGCSISRSRSPRCWPGISSHGRARRRVEHGTFAATVERGSGASRHTPALTLNTPTIASSTGAGKTMRSRTSMRIAQSNRRS